MQPSDVDLYKLSDTVNDVKVQIMEMQNVLKSVSDNQACLANTVSTVARTVAAASSDDMPARTNVENVRPRGHAINAGSVGAVDLDSQYRTGEGAVDQNTNTLSKSFVDMFVNSDDGDSWFLARPPKRI